MQKVLIATIQHSEPVLRAATKLGPEKIVLLVDDTKNEEQDKSLKLIKDSIGKVIEIQEVNCKVYDIVDVAKTAVSIIDQYDKVYINVTSGKKTKAIGLLFAAYVRPEKVIKIAYNPEDSDIVYLPKLHINLRESQKNVLKNLDTQYKNYSELASKIGISRAMLYKNLKDLREMDMIDNDFKLTDAGRIARL